MALPMTLVEIVTAGPPVDCRTITNLAPSTAPGKRVQRSVPMHGLLTRTARGRTRREDHPMGFMSGITGNAGPMDPGAAASEFARLLSNGEGVYAAFDFVRDAMLFTNGRLILIDKQGISG